MIGINSLQSPAANYYAQTPLFGSHDGVTVREPLGSGKGWWAGAPVIWILAAWAGCYALALIVAAWRVRGRSWYGVWNVPSKAAGK